jgi:hypothetical protein
LSRNKFLSTFKLTFPPVLSSCVQFDRPVTTADGRPWFNVDIAIPNRKLCL